MKPGESRSSQARFYWRAKSSLIQVLSSIVWVLCASNAMPAFESREDRNKRRKKEWAISNSKRLKENARIYYLANRESRLTRAAEYRKRNAQKIAEYKRINARTLKEKRREYVKTDRHRELVRLINKRPEKRLTNSLRSRLHQLLKGHVGKSALLGCTGAHLRAWLESQFTKRMTWENYGTYWHIDHIHPLSSYDLTDPEQRRIACNWTNLRPLEAKKNIAKRDKVTDPQHALPLQVGNH